MFSLVPLTDQSGAVLEQIHKTCFPDSWEQATFDFLLQEKGTCGWLAMSLEGIPIGFILARGIEQEAEILTFCVRSAYRKQGIGRHLLGTLIDFLRSLRCQSLFLEVAVDNEAALALYKSMGFKVVGMRPNYYEKPSQHFVSACIMGYQFSLP